MSVVYGYETARRDDPIINVVDRAVNLAVASIRPEVAAFLGFFPFRKSSLIFDPWYGSQFSPPKSGTFRPGSRAHRSNEPPCYLRNTPTTCSRPLFTLCKRVW
ncbi:hypothetical protein J3R83DRAFT_12391 [Lanmaoa asiatica]|nr:hypothetical protein J3R83DRAFT_12391 [Lanmaoa asiatica]